jgi:hypothetical protein
VLFCVLYVIEVLLPPRTNPLHLINNNNKYLNLDKLGVQKILPNSTRYWRP